MDQKHEPSQAGNSLNLEFTNITAHFSESLSNATAEEATAGEATAEGATAEGATAGEAAAGEAAAGEATAGEATAGEATAGEATAGEATAGEAAAGEAAAKEAAAGEATAGEVSTEEAAAKEAAAGEAAAGEAAAGEATAGEATAGEATAGEATAGEATAGEATAGEATAGEATAREATAREATAREATAGEATAGEATAGEVSAGEVSAGVNGNQLTQTEERFKKIAESGDTELQKCSTFSGIVKSGTSKYVEIGLALQVIKRHKFWKYAGHVSWKTFCPRQFGFSDSYANRIILSAKIATYLEKQTPDGVAVENMKPRVESQVRPIASVPKERWLDVWCQAVGIAGGIPTQKEVAFVVDSMFGPSGKTSPKESSLKEIVKEVVARLRMVLDEGGPKEEIEELVAELEEALKLKPKLKADGLEIHT